MKLEDQVCSLELAKRLKELGVKQENYFAWYHIKSNGEWKVLEDNGSWLDFCDDWCSAFTVAELGEMLRGRFGVPLLNGKIDQSSDVMFNAEVAYWIRPNRYEVGLKGEGEILYAKVSGDTEADARAKMCCYLIENNLVKP